SFEDASFYSILFGNQNKIHGHEDGLALTLYSDGEPLLIDAGKYAYDVKDTMRAFMVSRRAHNTVVLKESEYKRDSTVTLETWTTQPNYSTFRLRDPGYTGAVITRDIVINLDEKFLLIRDLV